MATADEKETFAGIPVARSRMRDKSMRPLQLFHGEAPGAIPNGTLIEKCNHQDGDSWPNGTLGTVLASMDLGTGKEFDFRYVYYIDFVADPGIPCMIAESRIKVYVDEED